MNDELDLIRGHVDGADRLLADRVGRALLDGAVDVRFDPVIEIESSSPLRVRASFDWPGGGALLSQERIVAAMRRTGRMPALDAHVLRAVGAQLRRWHAEGTDVVVEVPVAVQTVAALEVVDALLLAAGRGHVDPARMCLELAATTAHEVEVVEAEVRTLATHGFRVVLGTSAGAAAAEALADVLGRVRPSSLAGGNDEPAYAG